MNTPNETQSAKGGREDSLREEQALCRQAIESGSYDSMTDKAWVILCERVASDARLQEQKDLAQECLE